MFRIPLPNPNSNAVGDALEYIGKLRADREARQQSKDQFQQQFGLQQQANDRANKIFEAAQKELPFKLQQYKDLHQKSADEHTKNKLLLESANEYAKQYAVNPNEQDQSNMIGQQSNPNSLGAIMSQLMGNKENVRPVIGQQPIVDQPQGSMATYGNANNIDWDKVPKGQEITIRQGNLAAGRNAILAGNSMKGTVSPTDKNGFIRTTYPDGRITLQKDPTWTDKSKENEAVKLKSKEDLEDYKANKKDEEEANVFGKNLIDQAKNNEQIAKLMEYNPNSTGPYQAAKNYFKQGTKDYARFKRLATPLLAPLATSLSPRRSAYSLQLAQSGKYDPTQPYEYNQGILIENSRDLINKYDEEKEQYEAKHNKPYPYKLPKFYDRIRKDMEDEEKDNNSDKQTVEMYKNGVKHLIPKASSEDANKNWGYTYAK